MNVGSGFHTPSFTSKIIASRPIAVKVPKTNLRAKPNDVDPNFWQNVELNRYGNKVYEAHQFITPASYHMEDQPIRFKSVNYETDDEDLDDFDEDWEDQK